MARRHTLTIATLVAVVALTVGTPLSLRAAPATYSVSFIGGEYPRALNEHGDAVGTSLTSDTSRAWVRKTGGRLTYLPTPTGYQSGAHDINDAAVVVGYIDNGTLTRPAKRAVRWVPTSGGYSIEILPPGAGDLESEAVAVNNAGTILGNRWAATGRGQRKQEGFVDTNGTRVLLSTLGLTGVAKDINERGDIITTSARLYQGTVAPLGVPQTATTRYSSVYLTSLNSTGQVAALAYQATSLGYVRLARYSNAGGWSILGGLSTYDHTNGINDSGDVVGAATQRGVMYTDAAGLVELSKSLSAGDARWTILDGIDINNSGIILALASNPTTGQYGAALLTPKTMAGPAVTVPAVVDPGYVTTAPQGEPAPSDDTTTPESVAQSPEGAAPSPVTAHTLSVTATKGGRVKGSTGDILCSINNPSCTATYTQDAPVTLTAVPNDRHLFSHWVGACVGAGAVCTLSLSQDLQTQAIFVRK